MSLNPQILTIAFWVGIVTTPCTHPAPCHRWGPSGPERLNRAPDTAGQMQWREDSMEVFDLKDPMWLYLERKEAFLIPFSCVQGASLLQIYLLSKIGSPVVCRAHISPTGLTPRWPLHSSPLSVNPCVWVPRKCWQNEWMRWDNRCISCKANA